MGRGQALVCERGASQRLHVVERLREREHLRLQRARTREVAGAQSRHAHRHQRVEPHPVIRRRQAVDRRPDPLTRDHRFVVREATGGALGGPLRVRYDFLGIGERTCSVQVPADVRQVRVEIAVAADDRMRELEVHFGACNRSEFVFECLAQECVREPERATVTVADDAGDERGVEVVECVLDVEIAHRGYQVDVELASAHGCYLEQ